MANGDIVHIKELGRFTIPGGGHTLAGVAKQNKVMVWGEISGTWEDTNGVNLVNNGGFAALGLTTCDYITLETKSSGGAYSGDDACFTAHISRNTEEIFCLVSGVTNPTAADAIVMAYFAVGDSNAAPEM